MKNRKPYPLSPSKLRALQFETWVVSQFESEHCALVDWRTDPRIQKIYRQGIEKPDLLFEWSNGESRVYFAIECAWRKMLSGPWKWTSRRQLEAYCGFDTDQAIHLFLALGIGGQPDQPDQTYFIPINQNTPELYISAYRLSKLTWLKAPEIVHLVKAA